MPLDPLTISALIAGGASLIQGIDQNARANRERRSFERQMSQIPLYDPMQLTYLGDTRRRRRAFEAGTDPMASYTREQILNQGAQTQANAVRSGRNQVGDLMRIQAGTNRALAGVGAQSAQHAERLFGMEGDLVGMLASRAYNRQLSDANRAWSEYARLKEESGRSIQAGLGMAMAPLIYGSPKTDSFGNSPGQAPWWE